LQTRGPATANEAYTILHRVRNKDLQSSVNNFNKFKRIATIFVTHYSDDMFY